MLKCLPESSINSQISENLGCEETQEPIRLNLSDFEYFNPILIDLIMI